MFVELRELLCSGAIRRHQLGAKDLLTPTSSYDGLNGIFAVQPIVYVASWSQWYVKGARETGRKK